MTEALTGLIDEAVRAIRGSGAQAARDDLALLCLRGGDRQSFLQRMLSADLRGLEPGQGVPAALLTPKSQVLFTMDVLVESEALWLVLPAQVAEEARSTIERYVVVDDVEVAASELRCVGVYGPGLAEHEAFGPLAELPPYAHGRCTLAGTTCWAVVDDTLGTLGLQLWLEAGQLASLQAELSSIGYDEVPAEALEVARVEAGTPRLGADLGSDHLLLEGGQLGRVSFQKGCYIGQEPVCRVHNRGQVARRLVGLHLFPSAEREPVAGDALGHADKADAGVLTSVVRSAVLGRTVALGYVHRKFVTVGTRLELAGGGEAEVQSLPLVPLSREPLTRPRYKQDETEES